MDLRVRSSCPSVGNTPVIGAARRSLRGVQEGTRGGAFGFPAGGAGRDRYAAALMLDVAVATGPTA